VPITSLTYTPPVTSTAALAVNLGVSEQITRYALDVLGVTLLEAADAAVRALLRGWLPEGERETVQIVVVSRALFDRAVVPSGDLLVCRDSGRLRDLGDRPLAVRLYEVARSLRGNREQTRIYASGVTECRRKNAYSLMGTLKAPVGANNPEWAVVAEFGTALHALFEGWLVAIGLSEKAEFRLGNEYWSGRADHRVAVDGVSYILDLKTVSRRDFAKGPTSEKFAKYRAQMALYCAEEGLETALVLLYCRDSGRLAEYTISVGDGGEARRWSARAAEIVLAVRRGELPVADDFRNGEPTFGCRNFCPFLADCTAVELSRQAARHNAEVDSH